MSGSRRRVLLSVVLVACTLGVVIAPSLAEACVCTGGSAVCRAFDAADAVFVATARSRGTPQTLHEPPAEKDAPPITWIVTDYTFTVDESFKGVSDKTVQVRTLNTTCDFKYEIGKSYLFFAQRDTSGRYSASVCSGTQPTSSAAAFLTVLRQMKSDGSVTKVVGRLTRFNLGFYSGKSVVRSGSVALAGTTISLRGVGGSQQTQTDDDGRFVFAGLARGRYTLQAALPAHLRPTAPGIEAVEIGACPLVEVNYVVRADAPLSVGVRQADGSDLKWAEVSVIKVSGNGGTRIDLGRAKERRRANDEVTFDGLPPGKYAIAVNLDDAPSADVPYPTTYYPSAASLEDAELVDVVEGRQVHVDVRMGAPLPTRTLTVVVVDAAGVPVQRPTLFVDDQGPLGAGLYSGGPEPEWKEGRSSQRILEGRVYKVWALGTSGKSDEVLIPASGDVSNVRLVVKPY